MSEKEVFTALVEEFFETLGLPAEATPESGVYTLGVDERLDIHITSDEQGNVIFFSSVGEITSYGYAEKKYEWLLSRYRVGNPTACHVYLSEGDVILWRSMLSAGASAQSLISLLESFSTAALDAQANLDIKKPSLTEYEQMQPAERDSLPPWAVRG